MITSIVVVLLIAFVASLIANVLSNLARIEEMKELKKELRKFEKAFHYNRVKALQKKEEDIVTLIVKEEDNLPKFGDE